MLDLILRNATLADGRRGIDIGVQAGHIEAVEPNLRAEAGQTIDAQGRLPRRRSSTPISTWTRPCRSACPGATAPARCWKASRCGAS
jgi:hypothetical protein